MAHRIDLIFFIQNFNKVQLANCIYRDIASRQLNHVNFDFTYENHKYGCIQNVLEELDRNLKRKKTFDLSQAQSYFHELGRIMHEQECHYELNVPEKYDEVSTSNEAELSLINTYIIQTIKVFPH